MYFEVVFSEEHPNSLKVVPHSAQVMLEADKKPCSNIKKRIHIWVQVAHVICRPIIHNFVKLRLIITSKISEYR